jgi:hypothetical protein
MNRLLEFFDKTKDLLCRKRRRYSRKSDLDEIFEIKKQILLRNREKINTELKSNEFIINIPKYLSNTNTEIIQIKDNQKDILTKFTKEKQLLKKNQSTNDDKVLNIFIPYEIPYDNLNIQFPLEEPINIQKKSSLNELLNIKLEEEKASALNPVNPEMDEICAMDYANAIETILMETVDKSEQEIQYDLLTEKVQKFPKFDYNLYTKLIE